MLPLRYAWAWLVVGLLFLALGLVSALSPMPAFVPVRFNDKLIHMAGFVIFMVWFGGIFQARFAFLVVVGLSSYGLLIELLQSLTQTRQGEVLDLVADVAGILLGWAFCAAGLSRWCVKLESWFARPSH